MPRLKHMLSILSIFLLFTSQVIAIDLTLVTPTLTTFGSLAAFTPPADCFSRSIWWTSRFYDNINAESTFVSRFFTRWYIGCNINSDTGEYNTCCPPNYNTWGFYALGVCPEGYSTVPNNAANPWIGDQRGTVCCPSIKSPSGKTLGGAGFVTSFVNPLARDPISISCFEWDDDITTSGKVFQANYNARAIIVFGDEITGLGTFQFQQLPDRVTTTRPTGGVSSSSSTGAESTLRPQPNPTTSEDNTTSSSPSPGSTTSAGASQTGTSLGTITTETSTSTPHPNSGGGAGGSKGLGGGAIAGIAIGVAVPVITAIAFVAYKLGRGRQDIPIVPIHNDPSTKEMGYGGTQDQAGWR
ncbi:hypothetical protein TWF730_002611 [Orbilia blumenaviensis]|uniref:Uncharacterized protein n=1 Tax=Orbilia blumenaviensis TaxID=1796055 RepID=A0AAV9UB58_9PEZI